MILGWNNNWGFQHVDENMLLAMVSISTLDDSMPTIVACSQCHRIWLLMLLVSESLGWCSLMFWKANFRAVWPRNLVNDLDVGFTLLSLPHVSPIKLSFGGFGPCSPASEDVSRDADFEGSARWDLLQWDHPNPCEAAGPWESQRNLDAGLKQTNHGINHD